MRNLYRINLKESQIYLSLSTLLRLQRDHHLHDNNPGCRSAIPWAMRFCAYSAIITPLTFDLSFVLRPLISLLCSLSYPKTNN